MSEHDWRRIDWTDQPRRICNNCVQCNCCDDIPDKCPGRRIPSGHIDSPDFVFLPGTVCN